MKVTGISNIIALLTVFLIFNTLSCFAEYSDLSQQKMASISPKNDNNNLPPGEVLISNPQKSGIQSNDSDINLNLDVSGKHSIKYNNSVNKLDTPIFKSEQEKMEKAFQIQKKMDVEDIKLLWEATVSQNPVIKFALKKLSAPAEQRRIHSSLMAKTVSALISGASILPSMFGVDNVTSTASLATGSLANRIIQNKTMPKNLPLTDTELIQLASLVENLQDKIIKDYYDYKSSINSLIACRQNLLLQNKNYSNAIKAGNEISIIASSALYDKELLNELKLKQQIKYNRLELERLAGTNTVANLNLTKLASFNADELNAKKDSSQNIQKIDKKQIPNNNKASIPQGIKNE